MNKINISVPELPESVTNSTILSWHKKQGEFVNENEILVDIETDKVILEIPSPTNGILHSIIMDNGTQVISRQIIGTLLKNHEEKKILKINKNDKTIINNTDVNCTSLKTEYSPSVRRLILMHNLQTIPILGTGIKNRLTRIDVINYLEKNNIHTNVKISTNNMNTKNVIEQKKKSTRTFKRVRMTNLRKKISEKLLETTNNTASLTTFNEVNMQSVMKIRKKYGELFNKKYGVKLGLMSFYVKAVIEALKIFPEVNASIDQNDIIYYNYFDINIAISTPRGLVSPVLKNVDLMTMAEIEIKIQELALKGKTSKLTVDDLLGGTFTITNGGIFGSLFSTPLINPPQSAILGMHAIKKRPMVVNDTIKILPMMYLSLSYDHRLIDGKESVGFLLTIKEIIEDFNRIILHV